MRSCPIPAIPVPDQGRMPVSHFEKLSFQIGSENVVAAVTSHSIHQVKGFELTEATDWTGVNSLMAEIVAIVF
jgi:hypothetical protein